MSDAQVFFTVVLALLVSFAVGRKVYRWVKEAEEEMHENDNDGGPTLGMGAAA